MYIEQQFIYEKEALMIKASFNKINVEVEELLVVVGSLALRLCLSIIE
jgi:hypothetical protein